MTHPVVLLRRLLQGYAPPTKGVVQSIANSTAMVRTRNGIEQYSFGGIPVVPGMQVILDGKSVVGVAPQSSPSDVYDV